MVRLRREIEGVRRNAAVPEPSYAADALGTAWVLPAFDRKLTDCRDARVLLAGSQRRDLALQLARAGNWVTVADLDTQAAQRWHADLQPELAARLTLVARPYGEVTFGPASFDRVALFDALGRYRQPSWVLHKAGRELKPEALLFVRERAMASGRTAAAEPLGRALDGGLRGLRWAAHSPLAGALFGPRALEAMDRGAHLAAVELPGVDSVRELVAATLPVDDVLTGHPQRLAAAELAFGATELVRRTLTACVHRLPQAHDGSAGPVAVGIVARRALKAGVRFD